MVRRLTHREWVSILLSQGSTILCHRCREPITHADDCEREHLHERALDGGDEAKNARISHCGCHASISFGNGATTAGSSVHKVAKAKRLHRETALHEAVMAGSAQREPSRLQGRRFERVQRPFPKRSDPWGKNFRTRQDA